MKGMHLGSAGWIVEPCQTAGLAATPPAGVSCWRWRLGLPPAACCRGEARTAGKRMLWELRRLLDSGSGSSGDDFRRALARLDCKQDKASRALLVLRVVSRHG